MRQETAEALTESTGEIRDDYSGRGMYGKQTFGVVFDSQADFHKALVDAAYIAGEQDDDDMRQELTGLTLDSMGLGIVVY